MPEAFIYAQQLLAINKLLEVLPQDYEILIKEHPSTFRNIMSTDFKNLYFYDTLDRLERVKLVSLDLDPITLMKKSECVATLTGNVGVEALCNGIPVLYYGSPIYCDYPNGVNAALCSERELKVFKQLSILPRKKFKITYKKLANILFLLTKLFNQSA